MRDVATSATNISDQFTALADIDNSVFGGLSCENRRIPQDEIEAAAVLVCRTMSH
jgi:hypothetical protein